MNGNLNISALSDYVNLDNINFFNSEDFLSDDELIYKFENYEQPCYIIFRLPPLMNSNIDNTLDK